MNKINDIEVIINNKRYTLSGYESEEYLQKIASYINNKHNEFRNKDVYKFLDTESKSILVQINIADDYYKLKEKIGEYDADLDSKNKEIFEMKHELITNQTKLSLAQKEIEDLKRELNEAQKKIIRLETELKDAEKIR